MIVIAGGVQATVRIDMTMPGKPEPEKPGQEISPWEREAYGEGGRFGAMTSIPSGDPAKDRITVSFAGCAYHAARDLARKGQPVAFVSVVGEDPLGMAAKADLQKAGVDTGEMISISELSAEARTDAESPAETASGHLDPAPEGGVKEVAAQTIPGHLGGSLTSVRVEARNFLGDMEFWRVDERILKEFTPQRAEEKRALFAGADMVFIDGNLPAETIRRIGGICREAGVDLYFDPSSLEGAERGAKALDLFTGIMPGRREAELMSGLQILSADQLMEAGAAFARQGVSRTVITMKGGGLYFKEGAREEILRPERVIRFGETGGAGDVVSAALLVAFAKGRPIDEAAEEAMAAAAEYLADVVDERRY